MSLSRTDAEPAKISRAYRRSAWLGLDRWLISVVVFVIATSIIGLCTTLVGYFHAPQVLIASLLLTSVYAYTVRGKNQQLPGAAPRWQHVLLLLLVALLFRVPGYHYVMGGQDEGLYVNIAHYIQHTGGIDVHDSIRHSLVNTPYLAQYDANNRQGPAYLAGVYKDGDSRLEFQFYDLFPVWMAVFIGIFGTTAGIYALTFLALLSVVFFYRLALLITASHQGSLIAGGLLALSPLHAFFSKFPVTEIPTLCFSLIGFLLLAAYCSAPQTERKDGWLVLSVLAFLCVFMTRISGFMYVPFMIALVWMALLLDLDAVRQARLQLWAIGVTAAYLVSVLYGAVWSSHYAHDIYILSFKPLLGNGWKVVLAAVGFCVLVVWVVLACWSRRHVLSEVRRRQALNIVQWLPAVIVGVALCLGLQKIYWLGWTQHYNATSYVRWHIPDSGWAGASATSLWTLLVFMGPLLVLAFLASMTVVCGDRRVQFLRWFAAGFFVYAVLLQWVVPYSPYYSRYLLSELVPAAILFPVCAWQSLRPGKVRTAFACALILSLVYGGALSGAQIGKNELQGARASLAQIVAQVGPTDLILLDHQSVGWSDVGTPLLYTFHRAVVAIGEKGLHDPGYLANLSAPYDQTFLLTSRTRAPPPSFRFVTSSQFKVKKYEYNHSFPRNLIVARNYPLRLYRRVPGLVPVGRHVGFAQGGVGLAWLQSGWSHSEAWGTWSLGRRAVLSINPKTVPNSSGGIVLRVSANVLVNAEHPLQRVDVAVDGKAVASYKGRYPDKQLTMDIPITASVLHAARPITISFSLPDAISPAAISASKDNRQLAIGLIGADILASTPADVTSPRH